MTRSPLFAVAIVCCLLGACQAKQAPQAAVTEDEAGRAFDATVAAWQSQDAARIKALYAPDVAGFDFVGPLVTDRATWDRNQETYAAAGIDKVVIKARAVQLLGPDAFVVSSYGDDMSSGPNKASAAFRCTDVFKREAGRWLIVNENCSSTPGAA